jgi:hypothetical protein
MVQSSSPGNHDKTIGKFIPRVSASFSHGRQHQLAKLAGVFKVMLGAVGVELFHRSEKIQVIDSTNRHKRQNRYSRPSEVHVGYTDRPSGADFGFGVHWAAA